MKAVHYPGLADHPGKAVHDAQATGPGGMISFRTHDGPSALKIIDSVKVISYAESLGGVESLITYPLTQTHAALPAALRLKTGVTADLLRFSVASRPSRPEGRPGAGAAGGGTTGEGELGVCRG